MFPPKQVLDRVWIGSIDTAQSEWFMREHDIGLIVNCTRHIPAHFRDDIPTYRIPIDDSPEWAPLMASHLDTVTSHMHTVLTSTNKSVLVHCHAGVSRSSTVVAAYMILYHGYSPSNAIGYIQSRKPETFRPQPVFLSVLKDLHTP